MAVPSRKHQDIVAFFTKIIGNYIDEKEGDCRVYPAPFAVFLKTEEDAEYTNYTAPDKTYQIGRVPQPFSDHLLRIFCNQPLLNTYIE